MKKENTPLYFASNPKLWANTRAVYSWVHYSQLNNTRLIYVFFILDSAIRVAASTNLNIVAFLLFGYGVATSPFSYMASKESPDATGSFLAVFLSQISYTILAIAYLFNYPEIAIPIILLIVFGMELFQVSLVSSTWKFKKELQPS